MTFIPILVVLVALAAGLARIGFEKPPGAPINALTAKDLSVCLRDGKEIPAATKVALVPLSWETSSAAKLGRADKIAFVATAPIQVEIAPADREAADKSTTIPGSRSFTVGMPEPSSSSLRTARGSCSTGAMPGSCCSRPIRSVSAPPTTSPTASRSRT